MLFRTKTGILLAGVLLGFAGCATTPKALPPVAKPAETVNERLDAARKVIGGMSSRDVSREDFGRVAGDIEHNEETRAVVGKIIGSGPAPAVKYSPTTGKHYNGNVDVDPETGEKLEVLPE